ncbi:MULTISPECIES: beta 1-4 rhamnosyltransferase Cps2T [Lacticaseibacillus]|uniref:beta 1-4 rhamnosyltransferase Cps2T n=1 Tax=Lacticaseibacillus TaxID=2759736 RepID=UPI00063DD1BD|nr:MULTISPECIES: DUF1972 domain-containing protein [Lacticaseibacillus]KLI76845.1 glycosyl transferase [Lacticaseibacillus casei]
MTEKRKVFIIGSKGTPAKYGGFETFVDNLVSRQINSQIQYFIACRRDLSDNKADLYSYKKATCFNVDVPNIGPAKAILYDLRALSWTLNYIRQNNVKGATVYILACRVGPFLKHFRRQFKHFDTQIFVNPDGHEWMRAKWGLSVREYWKLSERLMIKNADLVICDSKHIELYIREKYRMYKPKTIYSSYGADVASSKNVSEKDLQNWFDKVKISSGQYYLMVGRFVPENNYKTIIAEFEKSTTAKDLVIITNPDNDKFLTSLKDQTGFENDKRIKFVGTVYDKELLSAIRRNAFAYIHGHEVGGTNPSLLEALGTTELNLLLNVGFNKEVGQDAAIYWNKQAGNLSHIIDTVDHMPLEERHALGEKAKDIIKKNFSWDKIVSQNERQFIDGKI